MCPFGVEARCELRAGDVLGDDAPASVVETRPTPPEGGFLEAAVDMSLEMETGCRSGRAYGVEVRRVDEGGATAAEPGY